MEVPLNTVKTDAKRDSPFTCEFPLASRAPQVRAHRFRVQTQHFQAADDDDEADATSQWLAYSRFQYLVSPISLVLQQIWLEEP